jgi:hypothetical protein
LVEVTPWNLVENSENFSVWSAQGSSVSTDSTTAPNGTTTADTIIESNTTDEHNRFVEPNIGSGQFTYSVYLKKYNADWCALYVFNTAVGGVRHWVNLSTLTAGTSANIGSGIGTTSVSISDVGNGWCRASITFTNPSGNCRFYVANAQSNGGSSNYAGNGTSGVYAWGGQVNIGSTAKPYFPTTDRLNVPRLTYQNGGGGCPSLLLEKQSTNLITYSEDFTNAGWTKYNATITGNDTTSPDGTQNADKFVDSTNNDIHALYLGITISSDTTISIYVKSAEYTRFAISNLSDGGDVLFNLSTVAVISTSANFKNAKIESVGNGWYRISATTNGTSGGKAMGYQLVNDSGAVSFAGTGSKGVYVWGAQYEASSYPTSYIPTTSASATRVADSCSKTGISSLIGQTEGVIFWNGQISDVTGGELCDLNANGDKFIQIYNTLVGSTPTIGLYIQNVSVLLNNSNIATIAYNTNFKFALAYKNNDYVAYLNGVQVYVNTTIGVPATSNFSIGAYNQGNVTANKSTNQVALFKTRLTNAELASLTTI